MRVFLFVLAILSAVPVSAFAGNCNYDDDTASDGSRCGHRSAESRDGGQ